MTVEERAILAWKIWGEAWSMNTLCHDCGEFKPCRGKRRSLMLCLECWDARQ